MAGKQRLGRPRKAAEVPPVQPRPQPRFLDQNQLAERWLISTRTLEGWRHKGEGPRYSKIGNAVRYQLDDIERYERQQRVWTP